MSFKLFWMPVPQPKNRNFFIQSILIPNEWIPMVYARLSELTAQEILVSILFYLSSSLIFFYCCFSFHVTEASVY